MSDLIDRQALLDECLNHYEVGNIEQNCTMDWICKTVRNFPAAPRWVRCEDDKPKERDYYYAFTEDAEAFVGEYIPSVDQWWNGDDLILTVTHWMPIEPPKEDA